MSEILTLIQQNSLPENGFDGSLSPKQSWELLTNPLFKDVAKIIDIRTNEERVFTGHIPDTIHIPWATGTNFTRNPRFIKEIENKVGKETFIILICRSGNRSKLAGSALKQAAFEHIYHISEGFEGELNDKQQRNQLNGWKFQQLPWIQS